MFQGYNSIVSYIYIASSVHHPVRFLSITYLTPDDIFLTWDAVIWVFAVSLFIKLYICILYTLLYGGNFFKKSGREDRVWSGCPYEQMRRVGVTRSLNRGPLARVHIERRQLMGGWGGQQGPDLPAVLQSLDSVLRAVGNRNRSQRKRWHRQLYVLKDGAGSETRGQVSDYEVEAKM